MRGIKMIDISYVTIIYFIFGYIVALIIEKILGKLDIDKEKKKSTFNILLDIAVNFSIIGIFSYVARNLAEFIPFPLDGINGFAHQRVKELHNVAPVFVFIVMYYQTNLKIKMNYAKDRIILGNDEANKKLDNATNEIHNKSNDHI